MQKQIIDLISWRLHVPAQFIYPDTHFTYDLNLDAFDRMMLIAELENHFAVYLSTEEVDAIETVKDASFFLQRKAAA